jgi:hypothetical protein
MDMYLTNNTNTDYGSRSWKATVHVPERNDV